MALGIQSSAKIISPTGVCVTDGERKIYSFHREPQFRPPTEQNYYLIRSVKSEPSFLFRVLIVLMFIVLICIDYFSCHFFSFFLYCFVLFPTPFLFRLCFCSQYSYERKSIESECPLGKSFPTARTGQRAAE